jgi:hypothetical protein
MGDVVVSGRKKHIRPNARKGVIIRGQFFGTQQDAADFFNVKRASIANAKRRNRLDGVGLISNPQRRPGKKVPCVIGGIEYASQRAAAAALGVPEQCISSYFRVLQIAKAKGGAE